MFEITSRFLDLRFCDGCRYTNERSRHDHLEASVRSSQDAMNLTDAQNRAGPADLLSNPRHRAHPVHQSGTAGAEPRRRSLSTLSPYTKPWAEAGSHFRWKPRWK